MAKKAIFAAVFASVITAGIFAQDESGQLPPALLKPMNALTYDFGPTVVGTIFAHIGDMLKDDDDIKEIGGALHSSGFGIAVQYERHISDKWSVAGRLSYLDCGLGIWDEEDFAGGESETLSLDMGMVSFSVELHARFYPTAGTFFLDGMIGYGFLEVDFFGGLFVTTSSGTKEQEELAFKASRKYFKYGLKVGWRIDFGEPGGLIFEPSLGYYGAAGAGKTIGRQVSEEIGEGEADFNFDKVFMTLENFIFVGGPRITLSLGFRF
jgi:hypothetical protein